MEKNGTLIKTYLILITIVLCLILLEVGLRALGHQPPEMIYGIYEQWGDSYRMKRNMEQLIKYPAFTYTVYTNSYGFRDQKIGNVDLKDDSFYVFLGASDVFGNGVDYEDSFVGILENYEKKRGIEVLNMAMGGHYFQDQIALFKQFINEYHLKPARLYFCLNGLHIPKFDKRNRHIFVKNGHLFEQNDWKMAYIRLMAGNLSSAYCFFRDNIRKFQAKWLDFEFKEDTPEFLHIYSKKNRMYDPKTLEQFFEYLSTIEKYCQQNNISIIYVFLPIADSFNLKKILESQGENLKNYDVNYYEKMMIDYCKRRNIKLIDLKSELEKYYNEGKPLRFQLDPHYNKFTNRIIGEYLIKSISSD